MFVILAKLILTMLGSVLCLLSGVAINDDRTGIGLTILGCGFVCLLLSSFGS